ncbi:DUF1194 domain-containing protein [Enhydrobacter sp.]|jgi:hypothetical protein|uniref:DUF1194 domain-containing protein n=1 Tax=Enhydrobacter sp. TaxID=1894999 RepID=UPI0026058676|nr:DUF1194 domain-containing protein [Enhydrobacter sp.]WIM14455.1 MAG: vWFA-like protein with metal ion dependent adhesion motif (MIDAS) [Enhydrobacter sp.]
MRYLACLFVLLLTALPAVAQEKKEVDVALALAIDISGSIDPEEARLQREGYVKAFRDPAVVRGILDGPNGRIAIAYFEWSDSWMQKLLIDWTLLDSEATIKAFADRLDNEPISIARRTSISGAIHYAVSLFARSRYDADSKVLDISGDGSNNDGVLVTDARTEALKRRIAINGLPIINDRPNPFGFPAEPDLDQYYLHCVTGGPHSFVEVAKSFDDFPRAVRKKLLQEVARRPLPDGTRFAQAGRPQVGGEEEDYTRFVRPGYPPGCDVGERRSREFWQRRFGTTPD